MLESIIHSKIGGFHTIMAIIAMVFGLLVILKKKGTIVHKRMGYVYVVSMLLLNVTSFFIVNFKGLSVFHAFAIISLISVLLGIIPVLLRIKNWYRFHFYFMNWSVVGLYCAFWAEVGTRFVGNMQQFWWMVAIATGLTAGIGARIINQEAKKLNLR